MQLTDHDSQVNLACDNMVECGGSIASRGKLMIFPQKNVFEYETEQNLPILDISLFLIGSMSWFYAIIQRRS